MNRNLYKRTLKLIVVLIVITICFTACQPTPDVAPVVNKSEGLSPDAIIEAAPEGEIKVIDAPAHWSETIERMDGHIKVVADTDVSVPRISNTPVIELKQYDFTDERLDELVSYFAGGARLYKEPKMTKAELEKELKDMENKSNGYEAYPANRLTSAIKRARELLASAPDNAIYEYVEPAFTYPVQPDRKYISKGSDDKLKAENTFEAIVEDDVYKPRIKAVKHNTDVGSGSSFDYRAGEMTSEYAIDYYEMHIFNMENLDNGRGFSKGEIDEYKNMVEDVKTGIKNAWEEPPGLTQEEAEEAVQKLFKELDVQDMGLYSTFKGYIELYTADDEKKETKPGYRLTYYKNLGGLKGYQQMGGTIYDNLPEQTYAPDFLQEKIEVFVTDRGVEYFSWKYITEAVGTVAYNTKLLPFDEIKQRLADHLFYTRANAIDDRGNPRFDSRFEIINAELRSGYINAFEAPQNVWLVPMWVFEIREYRIDPQGNERYFSTGNNTMINAIDGGYVSLMRSYDADIYSEYYN